MPRALRESHQSEMLIAESSNSASPNLDCSLHVPTFSHLSLVIEYSIGITLSIPYNERVSAKEMKR